MYVPEEPAPETFLIGGRMRERRNADSEALMTD